MPSKITPPKYSSRWFGEGAVGRYFEGAQSTRGPEQRLSDEEWVKMFMNPRLWKDIPSTQITNAGYSYDTPGQFFSEPPDPSNPLGDWDYKDPPTNAEGQLVNHAGEILPEGAAGWRPDGQPHWDNWFDGLRYKALGSTPKEKTPEEIAAEDNWTPSEPLLQQFAGLFDRPLRRGETSKSGKTAEEARADASQFFSDLWGSVSKPIARTIRPLTQTDPEDETDEQNDYTWFGRAGKVIGAGLWGGLELFGSISEGAEKGLGTVALTWKDLAGDRALDVGDWQVGKSNFNWVLEMTVAPLWNAVNAVTRGAATYSNVMDGLSRNYEAAAISYSIFEDDSIREEFIRRQKGGEDPRLLALELENPMTEIWGLMVLDPLNIAGIFAKAGKVTGRIDNATEFAGTASKGFDGVYSADRISDIKHGEDRLKFASEMVEAQTKITKNVSDKLETIAKKFNIVSLTTDGKRYVYGQQMAEATAWVVANHAKDVDEPFEIFKHLANLHSPNKEIVGQAMEVVLNSRSPDVLLSDRFQMFGKIMHDALYDPIEGVVDASGFLKSFDRAREAGLEGIMEFVEKTYSNTLDDLFPSLTERATAVSRLEEIESGARILEEGEDLARIQKVASLGAPNKALERASRFDALVKGRVYKPVNAFFSSIYMGMSPGYAFRNLISNTFHIIADEGVATFGKGSLVDSKVWTARTKNWLGGSIPQGAFTAIGSSDFGVDVGAAKFPKITRFALEWANKMEVSGSRRIIGKVVDETMTRMLKRGSIFPDVSADQYKNLVKAGFTDEAVSAFEDMVIKNFGDVGKAREELLKTVTDNVIDIRIKDTLKWIPDDDKVTLGTDMGELARAISKSDTLDEALEKIDEWHKQFEDLADNAKYDVPSIDPNIAENVEAVAELAPVHDAVKKGYASAETALYTNSRFVSNNRARGNFLMLVDRAMLQVRDAGADAYNAFEKVLADAGLSNPHKWGDRWSIAMQKNEELRNATWGLTRTLVSKKSKEAMATARKSFMNLTGITEDMMPPGMTAKEMRDYLWDVHFARTQTALFATEIAWFGEHVKVLTGAVDTALESAGLAKFSDDVNIAELLNQTNSSIEHALTISNASYDQAIGWRARREILREQLKSGKFEDAIRTLAAQFGISTVTKDGGARFDNFVLSVVNKYGRGRVISSASGVASNLDESVDVLRSLAQDPKQIKDFVSSGLSNAMADGYASSTMKNGNEVAQLLRKLTGGPEDAPIVEQIADMIGDALRKPDSFESLNLKTLKGATVDTYRDAMDAFFRRASSKDDQYGLYHASRNAVLDVEDFDDIPVRGSVHGPTAPGQTPSFAAATKEGLEGIRDRTARLKNALSESWEQTTKVEATGDIKNVLDDYSRVIEDRIGEARMIATETANAAREFTLLDYKKKTGFDVLAGYLFPYSFWYSRTYKNWAKRVVQMPQVIAAYAKYKDHLQKINAGAPPWWRNNIRVDNLPGLDLENPLFFNLEATLNPLNGLTGVDFNDPDKRLGWWTKNLDDIGKFGPTTWTPFNIIVALALHNKGEKDAAARWAGRLIPQTAAIRSAGYFFGGKDIELDPFVQLFSGGYDPYERGRIGRALGSLVESGEITAEQSIDASTSESGEVWDLAVQTALGQRAGGQIASAILGVGFKGRTEGDMLIDIFYQDYRRMWALSDNLSTQEFRESMDLMRERYPFMDALLIARRAGLEQDRAVAYNVLSRIPPGLTNEVAEMAGVTGEFLSKFYDDKGHIEDWAETDRDRFMAAVVDIGAVLALPDDSTREEWTGARNAYTDMREEGKRLFGEEVWAQVDMFYDASKIVDENQQDALRDSLISAYPQIQDALDFREQSIMNNQSLYKYYGGIDFYEKYWKGQIYDELENTYGDLSEKWNTYFNLKAQDDANLNALRDAGKSTYDYERQARAFWDENPELEGYIDLRDTRFEALYTRMGALGDYLVGGGEQTLSIRPDLPEDPSFYQEQLSGTLAPQIVPWTQYEQLLGPHSTDLMLDYFIDGEEIPPVVMKELTALAQTMGTDIASLISTMNASFQQELGQTIP